MDNCPLCPHLKGIKYPVFIISGSVKSLNNTLSSSNSNKSNAVIPFYSPLESSTFELEQVLSPAFIFASISNSSYLSSSNVYILSEWDERGLPEY